MWNPFRRSNPDTAFPKPKWPPIQALDSIDLVGARKDGGVDLMIVASQPLDDTAETCALIREKVGNYLDIIELEEFQAEMKHPPRDKIRIIISCEHPIHETAMAVIDECKNTAAQRNVQLELKR